MKKAIILIAISFFGLIIFTAQKTEDTNPRWIKNPAFSEIQTGVFNQLPVAPVQYFPVTKPRILMSPFGLYSINPSFMILPTFNVNQNEPIIVCCRNHPEWLFASANTISNTAINAGDYYSTNGGINWSGYNYINNGNLNNQRSDPGPAYDKNGVIIFTHLTSAEIFSGVNGIGAEYSTDRGITFSQTFQIDYTYDDDKNLAGTDDNPGSPYYGNSYVVWSRFTSGYFPAVIYISKTTNSGISWGTPVKINKPNTNHFSQGCDVCVGPNGNVYVTWAQEKVNFPYYADSLGFAISTDGGDNFIAYNNTIDCNGTRYVPFNGWPFRNNDFPRIDVDKSGGPRNGWIYIVSPQFALAPAGYDPDIVMYRSTDNGYSWSEGIRVNQDPLNNGKAQFFPAVKVDDYGGINVIYYDNRYWANSGDSATVFISRSTDGGNTWIDIKLSDHNFIPNWGSIIGDYIGITSTKNFVWGIWMDNTYPSQNISNVWVASFSIGIQIKHSPIENTEQTIGYKEINCIITPAGSGINPSLTKIFYAKNNLQWSNVPLTNYGGNNWTGNLPLSGPGIYNYYLSAADSLNVTANAPAYAPVNYYSFVASQDTLKPLITHIPISAVLKTNWPVNATATVSDNIGIDSVWVNWYRNKINNGIKHFKLNFSSGNLYSAVFNSQNSEVSVNDSIFYKIFAKDNSNNHNMDSTQLYGIRIIDFMNYCVGTGPNSLPYPFYTAKNNARSQMLFKKSELLNAGLTPSCLINRLGFDVNTYTTQEMNEFNLRLQNTTLDTISDWINSGWTTLYTGIYAVPGIGWQYIEFNSPYFEYDGNANLLVEICFHNQNLIPNNFSSVKSSIYGGGRYMLISSSDTTDGCTIQHHTLSARPYVCFSSIMQVGINNLNNKIPNQFSLSQNYPNPFNPVTRINFAIPKQGLVSMKIYDVLGREVRTLVNEVKGAGSYSVDFNAAELSSGVYFYRLESNGFTDIKRMMLIK